MLHLDARDGFLQERFGICEHFDTIAAARNAHVKLLAAGRRESGGRLADQNLVNRFALGYVAANNLPIVQMKHLILELVTVLKRNVVFLNACHFV